jgi:hypothetical protein
MRLARATIAAAPIVVVVPWSHASIIRFCCGYGHSARSRGLTATADGQKDRRWQVQTPRLKLDVRRPSGGRFGPVAITQLPRPDAAQTVSASPFNSNNYFAFEGLRG